jgi:hypothetical protein
LDRSIESSSRTTCRSKGKNVAADGEARQGLEKLGDIASFDGEMLDLLSGNQMRVLTRIERDICLCLDSDDRFCLASLQLEIRQVTTVARVEMNALLGKSLNPGSVTLMEKSPEGKPWKENSPALLLVLVRWSPVAWFVRDDSAFIALLVGS